MKYLPSILLFLLAFGMGLAAAKTYPGPFSTLYTITAIYLLLVSVVSAEAAANKKRS